MIRTKTLQKKLVNGSVVWAKIGAYVCRVKLNTTNFTVASCGYLEEHDGNYNTIWIYDNLTSLFLTEKAARGAK